MRKIKTKLKAKAKKTRTTETRMMMFHFRFEEVKCILNKFQTKIDMVDGFREGKKSRMKQKIIRRTM